MRNYRACTPQWRSTVSMTARAAAGESREEMCIRDSIKETAVTHSDGHVTVTRTPKVTGKGQRYFVDKFVDDEGRLFPCA